MYDWSDLSFPTLLKDISKFEFRNSLTINVLGLEGRDIYLWRKGTPAHKLVNLLLASDGDKCHYTAVKSLSRLLRSSNSKHKAKQHFCMNCLQGFSQEKTRDDHYVYCSNNETVRVEIPKDPILNFNDGQGQLKAPFVIYANFESILEPMATASNDPSIPHINHINKHTPSGFCTYSTFTYGEIKNLLKLYRGKDCVEEFCKYIRSQARQLYNDYPEKPMIPLTKTQWKEYNSSNKCLKPISGNKVRDYCHYTGYYRGPAHSKCNLRYKVPSFIPIVFHNLPGYDAHMFIKELAKYSTNDMNVIAKSKESYISFSSHVPVLEYGDGKVKTIELRFIDSYKFMASSLDSLTTNLVKGGKRLFDLDDNLAKYKLLTRKGVYPYEYMDSWDRFNETRLPLIDKFYGKLNGVGISEDDYKHATNVWNEFDINNLGEYHNLYLRTDVALLVNVFEEFRNTCMKHYGLDPANF